MRDPLKDCFVRFLLVVIALFGSNVPMQALYYEVTTRDGITLYLTYSSFHDGYGVVCRGYSYDEYTDEYTGDLVIPDEVEGDDGKIYKITFIGSSAFRGCSGLRSIVLGDNITWIEKNAFDSCTGLRYVSIGRSIEQIDSEAFNNCTGINYFYLGNSSATFDISSLDKTRFRVFVTPDLNSLYYPLRGLCTVLRDSPSEDGFYYSDEEKTRLVAYVGRDKDVVIPNTVTSIGVLAFRGCYEMKSLYIPSSVSKIETCCFTDCEFRELEIPASVTSLGDSCFPSTLQVMVNHSSVNLSGYNFRILTDTPSPDGFYYDDSEKTKLAVYVGDATALTIPNSVTSIGKEAFLNCSSLRSVTIGVGVNNIANTAFKGCSNLTKFTILANTVPTGMSRAMPANKDLITFVANDNYSGEEYGLIKKYGYLSSMFEVDGVIYVPVSPSERTCAAINCTYSPDAKDIVIGSTVNYRGIDMKVVELNPYMFKDNNSIESLKVSAEAAVQRQFAENCKNLKTVELDNSGEIGVGAFRNCWGLRSLAVGSNVTNVCDSAFFRSMINVTDGAVSLDNAGYIRDCAFKYCYGMQKLNVGSTVWDIGPYAFFRAMSDVTDGVMTIDCWGISKTAAFDYCLGLKDLTIGEHVVNVGSFAYSMTKSENATVSLNNKNNIGCFKGCTGLTSVIFPDSVCLNPESSRFQEVDKYTFSDCVNLKNIKLPASIRRINENAFYNCKSLANLKIPGLVTTICQRAFDGSGIQELVIPKSVNNMGGALCNSMSLERLEFEEGADTLVIDNYFSFIDNTSLKELVIGRRLLYQYPSYSAPFTNCTSLEKVTLTDMPAEVHDNEFKGCVALKEVNIGDGVTKIGDYAFSGCSALESFSFGASVDSIGNEAFSDCTAMTRLYAEPANPPYCGTQALDDINKWNCTLYVPASAIANYQVADQWKEFFFLEPYEFTTDISVPAETCPRHAGKTYNMQGMEVGDDYKGIVIRDGKKMLVK